MSEKNRKIEYDRLVTEGKKIPEVLVKEFGDPAQEAEVEDEPVSEEDPGHPENTSDEPENT